MPDTIAPRGILLSPPVLTAGGTNLYGPGNVGLYASPSFAEIGDDLNAFIDYSAGNTVIYINNTPVVASVTSTTVSGSYKVGSVIALQIAFDENVIVTVNTNGGALTQAQETGAIDCFATYVSGSGSTALSFRDAVKAGDSSVNLNFFRTSAQTLNGSTIKGTAGNNAIDYVDNAGDRIRETSAEGSTDTVCCTVTVYTLTSNIEPGIIQASGTASLTGNGLANCLYGFMSNNELTGNDILLVADVFMVDSAGGHDVILDFS